MADAIGHTRIGRRSGEDRRHGDLAHRSGGYFEYARLARRKRKYWDASYATGYAAGLLVLAADSIPIQRIPIYYCPGIEETSSFEDVSKAIRAGEDTHKTAYKWAEKLDRPVSWFSIHTPTLPDVQ